MKKMYVLFLSSLILCTATTMAQDRHMVKKLPQGVNRDAEMQCPANSIFSQGPMFWYAVSFQEQEIADDFTTASPPTSIRFWGFDIDFETFGTCQPTEMTFNIKFYERNLSDPAIPGDEFASYTLACNPQYMIMYDMAVFQIDLNFPGPVALTDGWVSVNRVDTGDPCWAFITGNDGIGGNACVNVDGAWVLSSDFWGMEFAPDLCLGGETPPVPLTNWALGIALVLILTFIILRYRRS